VLLRAQISVQRQCGLRASSYSLVWFCTCVFVLCQVPFLIWRPFPSGRHSGIFLRPRSLYAPGDLAPLVRELRGFWRLPSFSFRSRALCHISPFRTVLSPPLIISRFVTLKQQLSGSYNIGGRMEFTHARYLTRRVAVILNLAVTPLSQRIGMPASSLTETLRLFAVFPLVLGSFRGHLLHTPIPGKPVSTICSSSYVFERCSVCHRVFVRILLVPYVAVLPLLPLFRFLLPSSFVPPPRFSSYSAHYFRFLLPRRELPVPNTRPSQLPTPSRCSLLFVLVNHLVRPTLLLPRLSPSPLSLLRSTSTSFTL